MAGDLQGPLDDFYGRTQQLRLAMIAVESAARPAAVLTTTRAGIDLSEVGLETGNTTNAMALVYLASSFEEFVREEIAECADVLSSKYGGLPLDIRNKVRSEYWKVLLIRLGMSKSIMTNGKIKSIDLSAIAGAKALLDSGRGFVVDDDANHLDRRNFYHSSRNFRPHIVNELIGRLGINDIIASAADSAALKAYFGVSKKVESASKLRAKLDEFYDLRNSIVHSLSSIAGYGVDTVLDYINLLEMTADSVMNVLVRHTSKW